jgi:hypothetical protein
VSEFGVQRVQAVDFRMPEALQQPSSPSPLLSESSSSESVGVETVLSDLKESIITIPDYQRDGDQWDMASKSLLVESIINNLTIPALFFEAKVGDDGVERSEVVDGQQRLTALQTYYDGKFPLVSSDDAPYLSPNSVHYAGKTYDQLPLAYKQAFKRYRLTIIRLRNLGDMRLEVFRRINQGGTPLSGQDIRLAYFGDKSPSVAFIRLVGIHDETAVASSRFIESAKKKYNLDLPWNDQMAFDTWKDWWAEKELARGQTPSEMFLWTLVGIQADITSTLLQNRGAVESVGARYSGIIAEVLDTYCAQLRYQDMHPEKPPLLFTLSEISDLVFPLFQASIDYFLRLAGVSVALGKHRLIANVIAALYRAGTNPKDLPPGKADKIVAFIRAPRDVAKTLDLNYPTSKGRWLGDKGYSAQFSAAFNVVQRIISE